jgi:putative phosphoribosyl transferase
MNRFKNRHDAGRVLANSLRHYGGREDLIVLALPRGGVPVGYEIATTLQAPLDVFVVRKLGVPGHEELAMGAIATGDVLVVNDDVVRSLRIPDSAIQQVARQEAAELKRREELYRGTAAAPDLRDRTVIVVDDGLATGSTMRAAVAALRAQSPARIVVAVPTGARETCEAFAREADEIVCPLQPENFHAVGMWYEDFTQTTDDEVRELLQRGRD